MSQLSRVESLLAEHWGLAGARVAPIEGGMSSLTWSVEIDDARYVLKSVSAASYARRFADGLAAAARLDAAGVAAGAPVPTRGGELTVIADGQAIALLGWVEGTPAAQHTPAGMAVVGRTLARAHLALGTVPGGDRPEPYLNPQADHLGIRPWIRPAIARARAAVEVLDVATLTWGPLHGDPAAEAFLVREDGDCGLIDWGAYSVGPRVFDLASAVMYAGDTLGQARPLIDAYLAEGALTEDEVARALEPMLGWRWASQAYYFAWRIATDNLVGIADAAENEKGLAHARAYLDPVSGPDRGPDSAG